MSVARNSGDNPIGDVAVEAISNLPLIDKLYMRKWRSYLGNTQITEGALQAVSRLSGLLHLNVSTSTPMQATTTSAKREQPPSPPASSS